MIIIELKDVYDLIKHRDNDKPAVIGSSGYQEWWQHGEFIK